MTYCSDEGIAANTHCSSGGGPEVRGGGGYVGTSTQCRVQYNDTRAVWRNVMDCTVCKSVQR